MKKKWIWGTAILIVVLIVGLFVAVSFNRHQANSKNHDNMKLVKSHTPTLFLHGYGGSVNSEKFMVKEAKNQGVTDDVITAQVSTKGDVLLKGKWSKDAINPIVQVEFAGNKNEDPEENAKWFKNVLEKLQNDYHIKKFNFVGHSMANMSFAHYMLLYSEDQSLPQLNKQVNIAGTFNGVININEKVNEISVDKEGKPSRMNPPYQKLLKLKSIYKGKDIGVLNIYGDLEDGTHSDGSVSVSSAKSLKYLLGDSPKTYKELQFKGKAAEHSELHENSDVADQIIQFLWGEM
ncbi:alpha/beta hydrolase [Staphylococcus schleiferi]|uniref:alpha/beta hydrolase n=1 Tax=Staphylococcus coagulans TaxID=74706 RepID=UPI00067A3325|nr:alpha/beta hydrolase [Staphylococcus coagulans]AKS68160.1 alpha/beta hydrolase [Staphylococcus schleiferi]AKS70389.1 alpha/beta hydrolase [Staphylococcus schleiferi]AKS72539.1 alpha/beta hydrolase [Staphylococcus schleiferi]MBT2832708.1 alpha/beta hydrolase [Staphylococcus coagulans]